MNANDTTNFSTHKDGTALTVSVDLLDDFPGGNIRRSRNPESFAQLRKSISQTNGVTQGVTVRVNPDNPSRLQLLAGYGRRDATKLEGIPSIPVVIKQVDDKGAMAIMLAENLAREDLSVADEIVAAQRFVSYYDGNLQKAATDLNWSVKKLSGRLLLNNCSVLVLNALFANTIKIGHAEILSQFTHKLQDGTLERIINENWSVEYLKERAGVANRDLRTAKFDTGECSGCQHNSEVQASLFDNTVGKSRCGNLSCFKEKTDQWLDIRKSELSQEYALVLLDIEKPEPDRNTVSANNVGEQQFTEGCAGCISNAVILVGGINKTCGDIKNNQCVDTDCFRKMVSAHQPAIGKAAVLSTSTPNTNNAKQATSPSNNKKTDLKKAITKTPASAIDFHKNALCLLSTDLYRGDEHFLEAFQVACLIHKANLIHNPDHWLPEGIDSKDYHSFNDVVDILHGIDRPALKRLAQSVSEHYFRSLAIEPRDLMIKALGHIPDVGKIARESWKPTKEGLEKYLAGGVSVIARKSGFADYYEQKHGKNTFTKLAKKKDMIDAMVNTDFDWKEYAPDEYLDIVNTP